MFSSLLLYTIMYCAVSILFCFLHQFPRAQCLLYSSYIPDGATFLALMKRLKNEAVATYPQPPVLFTSSNCCREISVVASFLTAFQIFLQLIPFHLIIFSLWSKPRSVFLRKMWNKSKSYCFSLYKRGGKVYLCQTHALT